jgi:hypothetical protein
MDASRAVSSNRFRFVALATLAVCAAVACGGSSRPAKVDGGAADAGWTERENRHFYLEVLVSLPQHSGRSGSSELFQPPPSA